MRGGLKLAVWLGAVMALSCAGFASAAGEGPGTVIVGEQLFSADGGFEPKSVSRTEREPMGVNLEGEIGSVDGSHPPALTELVFAADRNLTVDATGIPTCNGGGRRPRDAKEIEAACAPAIIGKGEIAVEVAYPEISPITLTSKLLLINDGVSGGTTTWYLYAYFNAPITGEVFFPVEIKNDRDGRYGTRAVVTVPKIAGGYGSVLSLRLAIAKNVKGEDGEIQHPITGRCTDGELQFQVEANFADGQQRLVEIERACSAKA